MSDDQLYQQYLSGDPSAGDALVMRYGDALTAYLNAFLHHAQDAEDLMLDCFTVILVDKPNITDGHFRAYLFRIARNKVCRLWRTRSRHREFSLIETEQEETAAPEDAVWEQERSVILRRCMDRIAPQYHEALWLYYFMDMSYDQAAKVMHCSRKRMEDLLRNGKKRLRTELEKEGITHDDI